MQFPIKNDHTLPKKKAQPSIIFRIWVKNCPGMMILKVLLELLVYVLYTIKYTRIGLLLMY